MNHLEIAKNLRLYNRWRRGEDETLEQPAPADIGRWIDAAADAMEVAADAAVAQEQNAEQCVRLNRELERRTELEKEVALLKDENVRYARFLNESGFTEFRLIERAQELEWELNYAALCVAENETLREALRTQGKEAQVSLVNRVREAEEDARALRRSYAEKIGENAALRSEIERWRVATAKLRDAAEESGRVANEQMARAEQRVAELEAWQAREASAQVEGEAEIARLVEQVASLMKERDEMRTAAEKRYEEFRREAHAHFVAAGEIEKLERDIADITEVWGHEITDYLKARAEGRARKQGGAE